MPWRSDRCRSAIANVPASRSRLSWMLSVSVREYRDLVEGDAWPSPDVWERIAAFSGWSRAFASPRSGS